MNESPLARKLKLRAGQRAALWNAPPSYRRELGVVPPGVTFSRRPGGTFDWIQVFAKNRSELRRLVPRALRALGRAGILWIAFPKGTSSIQTDLTRDTGWEVVRGRALKWITLVSVNGTWSAFAVRKYRPGEDRHSFR